MAGDQQLLAAIRKRALGYEASETVCEYDADGSILKRKVSVKDVPPDMTAIKLLLELSGVETEPDEDELEAERQKVLELIGEYYKNNGGNNGTR